MITCRCVPMENWPRKPTRPRKPATFRVGQDDTLDKLDREIRHLKGKNVLIQLALTAGDLRRDGWPRANARVSHPGVILTFDSLHGSLSFLCDAFTEWPDNLRGIALTLERLRLVDLYSVTQSAEQYRGWKQLPPAPDTSATAPAQTPHTSSEFWPPPDGVSEAEMGAGIYLATLYSRNHYVVKRADVVRLMSDKALFLNLLRTLGERHNLNSGGDVPTVERVLAAAEILKRRHGL